MWVKAAVDCWSHCQLSLNIQVFTVRLLNPDILYSTGTT
jgi:hypothetical protein